MPKKRKELTPEEQLEESRVTALKNIGDWIHYMKSEPTYRFDVGNKVAFGAFKESVVEQVLYDGRAYLLRCVSTNKNYGKPYDSVCYRSARWVDVRPKMPDAQTQLSSQGLKLNFMNQTIESVLHRYYSLGVDMNPEYQRGFVWNAADKEYLLDSIFKGLDIGKFVFVVRSMTEWSKDKLSYEILDGKQRLNTLIEFYEDRITYKGYTYSQLGWKDRRAFCDHITSVAEIRSEDKKEILQTFLSLNRGGCVMNKEQLDLVESMLNGCKN